MRRVGGGESLSDDTRVVGECRGSVAAVDFRA